MSISVRVCVSRVMVLIRWIQRYVCLHAVCVCVCVRGGCSAKQILMHALACVCVCTRVRVHARAHGCVCVCARPPVCVCVSCAEFVFCEALFTVLFLNVSPVTQGLAEEPGSSLCLSL